MVGTEMAVMGGHFHLPFMRKLAHREGRTRTLTPWRSTLFAYELFWSLVPQLEAQLCFLQLLTWSQQSAVFMSLGLNLNPTSNGGTFGKILYLDES